MTAKDAGLTAKQRKALDGFLDSHQAVVDHEAEGPKIRLKRLKAIARARAAGVPTRLLIDGSGLNQARIYQLFDQARKEEAT